MNWKDAGITLTNGQVAFYSKIAEDVIFKYSEGDGFLYAEEDGTNMIDSAFCAVESGATKAVLIPDGDWVVKIPFYGCKGSSETCRFCDKCEAYEEYQNKRCAFFEENDRRRKAGEKLQSWDEFPKNCCNDCEDAEYEIFHTEFENANYSARKVDEDGAVSDWDYCEEEVYLYGKAVEWGVEDAFAQVVDFGTEGTNPIYLQKKIACDDKRKQSSKESQDAYRKSFGSSEGELGASLGAVMLEKYGYDFVCELLRFLETYGISDLHCGNWGFDGDMPKIVDYAGYHEND